MDRIERLLHALGFALVIFITALTGCGGGGGGGGSSPSPTITSGLWTWTSGTNIVNQAGVYGTKGASTVPGAREASITWTDASGIRWLFGGNGLDSANATGTLNDLWKFDGTDWIWVHGADTVNRAGLYPATTGVPDPGADPGSRRSAASWTDASGNLWLFGGNGYDQLATVGKLNDLWKFEPTSGSWTWVSGAKVSNQAGSYGIISQPSGSNVPGARESSVSWIDTSGNLWLFGGYGRDSAGLEGQLNDLWKFDGTNWTWVSGGMVTNQTGTYGTKGVAAASNVPGAREGSVSWIDASGNPLLFGGWGRDINGTWGQLNDLWKFDGTNWTWVSGADTVNQAGVYGTKGVANASNVPGARAYSVSWIDTSGNLWLFGGDGRDINGTWGRLNDLWKFDGTNWTWVSGSNAIDQAGGYGTKCVASSSNVPGARAYSVSWTDASGNLWLFGGLGYDSVVAYGRLNDLWKFDGTNWTWVSGANTNGQKGAYGTQGAANVPGAREESVSWTDTNGNLWLFGGSYYLTPTQYFFNDLWKFDGTNWTWVSGGMVTNQTGTYGTKGVADAANVPGARKGSISWTDTSGNLWLFGGFGNDSTGAQDYLNDLWRFDGANWTWVSGANLVDQPGVYEAKDPVDNVPGARQNSVSWTDTSGNLWLFGGYGYDIAGAGGLLNDLWKFDGANWTWMSGANTRNQLGIYGTKGAANLANVPGARADSVSWIDASGNLWLFGGWGFGSSGGADYLNDLWKFDGTNWTWVSGANIVDQPGVYGTKGIANASNAPGAREGSVTWIDASGDLWLFGGYGYDKMATVSRLNDLWKFSGTNWTWVSGADTVNQPGVYGTKGVANASNVPGAHAYSASWTDTSGNLWLFGGYGTDSAGTEGNLNDLWRFTPQ